MGEITIRAARPEEAAELAALCRRSKAHWGYDAQFLRRCAASLTVSPASIDKGHVLAAQDGRGAVLGVASIAALDDPGDFDLPHLFVEPAAIQGGIGRLLFRAIARLAKRTGARRLVILSDPFAAPFYERMGARTIGDAPSDSIPGRRLPLLHYELR